MGRQDGDCVRVCEVCGYGVLGEFGEVGLEWFCSGTLGDGGGGGGCSGGCRSGRHDCL